MKKIAYILIVIFILIITSCASGQKVLFDANGGEGELKEIKVSKDGTVTLPKNSYTREGFQFLGWDINNDEVFDFSDGEVFTLEGITEELAEDASEKKDIEPMTLKAVWAPEK